MSAFDRRLTPARADLAAAHLAGQVEAARFVPGVARRVIETAAALRRDPDPAAGIDTEAIYGETVTVYDEMEGWAWGQLERDGYVGWLSANALGAPRTATHRVSAVRTFIYPTPSIKLPHRLALTLGSELAVAGEADLFLALADGGFVFARHAVPAGTVENDWVSVAELFVGTPYLWGGRTSLGLDCSALVQTALHACGLACPRDSDMQEAALGTAIEPDPAQIRRGDLLFWPGHVAIARDRDSIVHASGHVMQVTVEGLDGALARIAAAGTPLRSIRRLG
jgi:cell wall-associated NlpC family hydrolase